MRVSKQKLEHYRAVIDEYCRETGKTQYEHHEVADWAIAGDRVDFTADDVRQLHIAYFTEASRSHTITNPGGQKVRVRHCVELESNGDTEKPTNRTLWSHVDDASEHFLITALVQKRSRVDADIRSLKADLAFINERLSQRGRRLIQMSFNWDQPNEGPAAQAGA